MSTEPTPEARRDAWTALAAQLEAHLIATRENAKAMAATAKAIRDDTGYQSQVREADWHATRWAADRLLKDLGGIAPPVVPVDHARGQLTLVEEDSSTPGDNPGEEPPCSCSLQSPQKGSGMDPRDCPGRARHPKAL